VAVDINAIAAQVAQNLSDQAGVKSVTGDEGTTVLHDPVDQLLKLEELRHRQHKRSTAPTPRFNGIQTFGNFNGLAGGSGRRFNRL
jgi:hypothetical protein